jgi:hypothetical protein
MTDFQARLTTPSRGRLARAAQALRSGLVELAWLVGWRLALVVGWLRRSRTRPDLTSVGPCLPSVSRGSSTPEPAASSAAQPESLPVRLARAGTPEFVGPQFVHVIVEPELDESRYAARFAELLRDSGAKLLDLRGVRTVSLALFTQLTQSWTARRDVPRLGILLDYERWALLHAVGGNRLRPIAKAGTDVEIFYEQQLSHSIAEWFSGRCIEHPLPAILAWLRDSWRPGAAWTGVIDTTAMLIRAFGHQAMVPDLLLQLAAITLAKPSIDGAAQSIKHIRVALVPLRGTPSRMLCRARRLYATALRKAGEIEPALLQLRKAVEIAAEIGDRIEGGRALADVAAHELDRRQFEDAEAQCRAALVLLAEDEPHLRASTHHQLAVALYEQRKDLAEAEYHAERAEDLRWDRQSRLAIADRELRARIRTLRASLSIDKTGVTA